MGKSWSDLRQSPVSPSAEPPTDIGTSWIPEVCNKPSCGHLLKGDVIFVDENGDGNFDDTWYDTNSNGIRENGEVDRLRADQFGWGATSTIVNFNNLGSPTIPQILLESGTSPPGLSRARVRVALGDNPECVDVRSVNCHISSGGAGVIATPFSITDDFSNPNDTSSLVDNNEFYGVCDPDRFSGDLISIQRQLDNCLWKVGSTPVTAPRNATVTGEGNAFRGSWVNQVTTKYVASNTTDRQVFTQVWRVDYGFQEVDPNTGLPVPIDEALYENSMFVLQHDLDPSPSTNFWIDPNTGQFAVNANANPDTYDSQFFLAHSALARRYGRDFENNQILPPGDPLQDKTNPTDDPFWLADDSGTDPFDKDFDTDPQSGVGRTTQFKFKYAQEVEGILYSCLNCSNEHPFDFPEPPSYVFNFQSPGGVEFLSHDQVISGATFSIP